jgi:hypothetical protein
MSIEAIQIFTRPTTETPWFHDTWSAGHMEYIQTTYKGTGKYAGSKEISSDGLMLTVTHTFTDETAQFEFMTDEYLIDMVSKRDAHNISNNITQLA